MGGEAILSKAGRRTCLDLTDNTNNNGSNEKTRPRPPVTCNPATARNTTPLRVLHTANQTDIGHNEVAKKWGLKKEKKGNGERENKIEGVREWNDERKGGREGGRKEGRKEERRVLGTIIP